MSHKILSETAVDDTVQCLFFSPNLGSDLSLWEDLCKQINDSIKIFSEHYIWNKDEFQLYVPIGESNERGIPTHLCSTTCFGDNLEDEWFIVYVVLEISKLYKNLIIQIKDSDGDFLLIEAANYLQSWAKPENTENRVYIYDHHIHIISPELVTLKTNLDVEEAINTIIDKPELTQASQNIQQAVLNRIGNYPEKISENIHRAVVKLPSNLATLLTLKPSLIAPIVNAYRNHDLIDVKSCKNMDFEDCVPVEVKFTKYLYASLIHCKLINSAKKYIGRENNKKDICAYILMCGFHIIMNNTSINDSYSSKEYHRFLNRLKQNRYFKDNIEGSKEYNCLLERAQHYFSSVECPVSCNVSENISTLMKSREFTDLRDLLKDRSRKQFDYVDDSEDWLNIHPEELNELLYTRYGQKSKFKHNDVISSETITQELSSFLKQTSDFEGIELNQMSDEMSNECEHDNIDFESDQFVSSIEKMLNILSTGGNEDTESDDSEVDTYYNEDDAYNHEDDDDDDCNIELKAKLQQFPTENLKDNKTVLANIIQSVREEKASTGPSSNLLRSLGVNKTELLDSDDD